MKDEPCTTCGDKCELGYVARAMEICRGIGVDPEKRKLYVARFKELAEEGSDCGKGPIPTVVVGEGPGTEMENILSSYGLKSGSICKQRANKMNRWGAKGCREHREEIVKWLKSASKCCGWLTKLVAGVGLARQPWFSMKDPAGSVVDEAIRRSEQGASSHQTA